MPSKLNKLRKNAQPKKTGNIFVLEQLKGDWRVGAKPTVWTIF